MAFTDSSLALSGKYRQIKLIGQGACGSVYSAIDNLERMVAVKEAISARPGCAKRFQKEVRIQAILAHTNIIQVYHFFEDDPLTHEDYLICEYANGGSLTDHLRDYGPLTEAQATRVTLDICAALEAMWAKRIVHRDVKPSNILLVKDDQGQITMAKLGDFGVARDLNKQPTTQNGSGHPGTLEYMAPEQADITRPIDVRTDLYALGICLWEMLTKTDYKLVAVSGPPVLAAANSQASPAIAEAIRRAIQDKPADRYQTPQDLAADLLAPARPTIQLPPRQSSARRRRSALGWATLLALLLLVGGYWAWSRTWAYQREGEHPDQYTVGQALQRNQALNGMVHGQFGTVPAWPAQAGFVQYDAIITPQVDHLYLKLRYSKNSSASIPIQIFFDAEKAPRTMLLPVDQGDWDRFTWTEQLDLGRVGIGRHSIRFATDGQEYGVADLDRFTLATSP